MTDLIYAQLALPSNKVDGYVLRYAPGRLPSNQYELQLYPNFHYIKDQFDRWVAPDRSAIGYGETLSAAVTMALAHLDVIFASTLIDYNSKPPKALVGLSTQKEVDELTSLLNL